MNSPESHAGDLDATAKVLQEELHKSGWGQRCHFESDHEGNEVVSGWLMPPGVDAFSTFDDDVSPQVFLTELDGFNGDGERLSEEDMAVLSRKLLDMMFHESFVDAVHADLQALKSFDRENK